MRDKRPALTGTLGPARPVRDRAEREALHGDRHGTTTPAAMLRFAQADLGDRLSVPMGEQDELAGRQQDWRDLTALRSAAGLARRWSERMSNDIGLFWPPQRQPVLVTHAEHRNVRTCNATIAAEVRGAVAWSWRRCAQ